MKCNNIFLLSIMDHIISTYERSFNSSPSPHPNVYILRFLMATSVRDCILHARTTSNKTATGEGKRGEEGKQSFRVEASIAHCIASLASLILPIMIMIHCRINSTLHCTLTSEHNVYQVRKRIPKLTNISKHHPL